MKWERHELPYPFSYGLKSTAIIFTIAFALNNPQTKLILYKLFAQSSGAVEYTDCFSAEG